MWDCRATVTAGLAETGDLLAALSLEYGLHLVAVIPPGLISVGFTDLPLRRAFEEIATHKSLRLEIDGDRVTVKSAERFQTIILTSPDAKRFSSTLPELCVVGSVESVLDANLVIHTSHPDAGQVIAEICAQRGDP